MATQGVDFAAFVMPPSFAGISVVTGGKDCTTSRVDAVTASGYHLLVVNDYSRTVRETPNGKEIRSGPFMVSGHGWRIEYCPNGYHPDSAEFVSFYIRLSDGEEEVAVDAKFEFTFVDQVEMQRPMRVHAGETFRFSSSDPSHGCPWFMRRDVLERSGNRKGDCFTIRCDIMVCNTDDVGATISDDIHHHFDHLLKNEVGADVTFEVGDETFVAHRCMLAARSKVFMAQLFGSMTEGTTSSVIQIKDMEADVFAALLTFIYTDSLPKIDRNNNTEEGKGQDEEEGKELDLTWLQELLVVADRYDTKRLKVLCENKLSEHIGVSSVASTLSLAEQHHCPGLKEACFKFTQVQSPECLDKVMATDGWEHMITSYPSVLKELVAKLVSN